MRRKKSTLFYVTITLSCLMLWIYLGKTNKEPGTQLSNSDTEARVASYKKSKDSLAGKKPSPTQESQSSSMPWYPHWYKRFREGRKLILLYTTWFALREWGPLKGRGLYERMDSCEKVKNCLLTYDKSWIKEASGVVFHARDVGDNRNQHYSAKKLGEVRKGSPLTQKWIFLSHENPWKDKNVYKPYDGLFNWTATFDRTSNIFIPYKSYALNLKPHKVTRNYAKERTGLVAWAVSNCGSKLRLEYARQLQRYVSVAVYGKCNCYFAIRKSCKHFDNDCNKELSKYKFFLAFENDFCHDYVTEKYWERIQQEVVPIVMGSNYAGLAIPGSYIDASDFGSIRELADYLLYLDKNDDAYNKYFAYKAMYTDGNEDFYCTICEKLNSKEAKHHSQVILSEDYNYENNCGVRRGKIEKFEKQIENAMKDSSVSSSMYKNMIC